MNFRIIGFLFKEAFLGFRRGGLMTLITIITIMVSLILLGVFFVTYVNMQESTDHLKQKTELMVYLDVDLSDESISELKSKFLLMKSIKDLRYISKEVAWTGFKKKFVHQNDVLSYMNDNPLPDAFRIFVDDVDAVEDLAKSIMVFDGVEEVNYGKGFAVKLSKMIRLIDLSGLFFVSLLCFTTLMIIVNTIRLTVLSRKNEIAIMKLVGATNRFIKWPFIIEGILMGLIASLFAVIFLKISYSFISFKLNELFPFLPVVNDVFILFSIYGLIVFLGASLGLLGGYLSIKKLLQQLGKI
jgi:cell division transport system permease protein